MAQVTYESEYKKKNRFSFGKNWQDYLGSLTEAKISQAEKSLSEAIGNLTGKTFADIGCGSGLFSLAAVRLGAKRVVSCDVDKSSVRATKLLKDEYGDAQNWQVMTGSALDEKFIKSLGMFDVVYSWGVLHHTGDMYQAVDNVLQLVGPEGQLYLALYNRFTFRWYGGTSRFWLGIKQKYNLASPLNKQVMLAAYMVYQVLVLLVVHRKNPITYINNYQTQRGMSWKHDLIDWLGGLPYEFAGPDEVINYLGQRGYACKKLVFRNGIGCNEYLMTRI